MKTILQVPKIFSAGMLMIAVLLVIVSCKKTDDTQTPTSPPPVVTIMDVFPDPQHSLMSDFEIQHQKSFQAHSMYSSMKGGIGPMEVFKAGFGIFSAIEKYKKGQEYQAEINNINSSLNNIQAQLGVLENDFTALAAQLQFDMNQLMNEVYELSSISATTPIITAYSNSDENGFLWYSDQAIAHNSGSTADSIFITTQIKPRMNTFIYNYATGMNATTLQNAIQTLNSYVKPTSTSAGLLRILARNIVSQNKQSDPMDQYMVLENYFLQITNYQFQAMTIQLNCFSDDTLNYQSFSSWYANLISQEIELFLQSVNFLGVSLYDYRNQPQFTNDLQYLSYGIAPETHTSNMMARAQFVANLLYDAIGVTVPVMCGSIILPHYYNAGAGAASVGPFNLTVSGKSLTARTDTVVKSPLPYTYWSMAANNTQISSFGQDNQWQIFNYGKFGTTDAGWTSMPQTITLNNATWGNTKTPQGSVTPLWYNPRDPSKTSTSKTDSCVIQFAYFTASWKWGYMGPCLASPALRSTNFLNNYNFFGKNSTLLCPFVQQWHTNQHKFESSGGYGNLNYPNGPYLFQENFSGSFGTYSSGSIVAAEFYYLYSQPGNDLGSGITLYLDYNYALISGWEIGFTQGYIAIGTGIGFMGNLNYGYCSNADILGKFWFTGGNQYGNGFVTKVVGTETQRLSYEIEVQLDCASTSTTFNTQTNIFAQYVYNGRSSNY